MTKIFYDHETFSMQCCGGISRYFFELIRRMPALGFAPHLFVGLTSNMYVRETSLARGLYVPPFRFSRRIRTKINPILQMPYLARFRGGILHKTYYSKELWRNPSTKVVITIYDMITERFPTLHPETTRRKRYWSERADHIITISNSTRSDLIEFFGVQESKVTTVHLGISLEKYSDQMQGAARDGEPYLLYVGARGDYKNFDAFLLAYANSPILRNSFKLVCFGGGHFTAQQSILMQKYCLMDRVEHRNGDDLQLAQYYHGASALVYPSLYEGFGLPLLEAMVLSCPVICSSIPALKEVAGDAALYFEPSSVESIKETLTKTLFDETQLNVLRAKGKSRARAFSWDACAAETAAVYEALT